MLLSELFWGLLDDLQEVAHADLCSVVDDELVVGELVGDWVLLLGAKSTHTSERWHSKLSITIKSRIISRC